MLEKVQKQCNAKCILYHCQKLYDDENLSFKLFDCSVTILKLINLLLRVCCSLSDYNFACCFVWM